MTPLRQRFIEDMQMRNLAPTTQRSYLHYISEYALFYNIGPEKLDLEAIRQYELHMLHERKLSPQSVNTFISSVQFLYTVTLEMPWGKECFPRLRVGGKLPVVLSPEEVEEFFSYVPSLKYRAALMLCYGAGLRISEAVAIKVTDIDSQRGLIRVEQGKGRKDRYVMLSERLLKMLRCYARAARPRDWMFPSWSESKHLTASALSQACHDAARCSGMTKRITAHVLRHSFATHLPGKERSTMHTLSSDKVTTATAPLVNATDTRVIQALPGHSRIETTARYVRVASHVVAATISPLDRLGSKPKQKLRK